MICIYHSRDIDGFTSGAIIKRWYDTLMFAYIHDDISLKESLGDFHFIGYDYGQKLDFGKLSPELHKHDIIMIDVSLKMEDMFALSKECRSFTWIDHHLSAINDYESVKDNFPKNFHAVLENGIAACEVAWNYYFPKEPMPEAVKLLGEYDTWRNLDKYRWEERILPFQFGMRLHCISPETFVTDVIGAGGMSVVNRICEEGKTVLKYQSNINETQCKKAAFEFYFKGLRAICLNGGGFNSDVFKSVYDESKHDIMMPFQFDGKQWTVSLYTTKDDIDCSAIAKSMGGGGHLRASGFTVKDIYKVFPFMKNL